MNPSQLVDQSKSKFTLTVEHFQVSLKSLRTGRANASMLDGIMAEAYGSPMPLNQLATVTAPEAQLLQIMPFDPGNLQAIVTAIRNNQNLGMNPSDDGRVVRIPVPPLTEERRRDITKQVSQKLEDCMIGLRGVRHEAMDAIASALKTKDIGEDDAKRLEKQIDDAMNSAKARAEAAGRSKETEIMTV
jgi:ribosome recycling factor